MTENSSYVQTERSVKFKTVPTWEKNYLSEDGSGVSAESIF